MSKVLVIIPTYNEKENVLLMIERVMSYKRQYHLLIVDDNSPDGTAELVEAEMSRYPNRLFLHKRAGKLGLGTAYIAGFKWSMQRDYSYSIEMDCDFSHNPDDLDRLVENCEKGADLTVGSRYCSGGGVVDWPMNRKLLSYFASVYVRCILWISVKDTTAGFKCYNNEVLKKIELENVPFKGYTFQIYMKYAALKLGFKVEEIPILFKDRERGVSKMSSSIIKEAIFGVIKMRFTKFK
ncbi:MAG: polyprenol monophosphomannose synthase [Bacteroidetes bacterium]|nr:polyprenol monophosphomannose synthase [Bacteroidota bacterium]